MSTQVQSVIFEKSKYSVTEAKKWLRDNGFVAPKVDKTDRYLRFRQKEPSYFDESSFRTIPFGKGKGIKAIIGVPMKHNPFFDELDPDGNGHRIGAYAMLFTKAKNEWKRTGDPLELAKAKEYWNQYLDARDRYKTVEDRRGASILLHEMGSFDQAIQNPKQRNNPMKTHKNPVIDGKTIVANLKGLRKLIGKSIPATEEAVDMVIYKVMTSLEKINDLGIKADMTQRFKGVYKKTSYQYDFFKSSMGEILLIFTQPKGSQKVKVTLEYILDFPMEYTINEMRRDGEIDKDRIYGYLVKKDSGSKYLLELLEEYVLNEEALKEAVYIPEPEPVGISPKEPINITRGMKNNPHCHCYGHKKNPHCPTHGRKKNPYGTAFRHGHMSGLAYRYNPTKKIMSFESFMDNLADGNVFVGRYVIFVQDGVPMRLEVGSSTPKEVSPEVAFYADLAGQAELVGTSDIDAFSDDYRGLIRQASDASSGGFVAGGGVPVVEVEEVEEITYPRFEGEIKGVRPMGARDFVKFTIDEGKLKQFSQDMVIKAHDDFIASYDKFRIALMEGKAESTYGKHLKDATEHLAVILASPQLKSFLSDSRYDVRAKIKSMTGFNKKTTAKTSKGISKYLDQATQYLIKQETGRRAQIVDEDGKRSSIDEVVQDEVDKVEAQGGAAPAQGGAAPEVDPIAAQIAAMARQQAEFMAQFKNNPRDSHYAYNMSTLDHNHRMSYVPLNNVYIKKNPTDTFKFPQTKVLGVDIDNDIYTWLSSSLPNWSSLIPLLTGKYANYKASVETLANQAKQFMVRMQTDIVPAVEEKVKKQLAEGKTLKDIVGKAKKNPRRTRRNTKRRRRYY